MLRYNEEVWRDLTYDEKMAYKIADQFTRYTMKRGQYNRWIASAESNPQDPDIAPGDKIRSSKNFRYFLDVWNMYKNDSSFDIIIFIESVFHNLPRNKKIYPAQLKTKRVYNNYKEYRMRNKMSERIGTVKRVMEDLARTYKLIKKKIDVETLTEKDLYHFFNDVPEGQLLSEGAFLAIQEMISPFYMAISKSFRKMYFNLDKDVQDEIIDKDKLNNIMALMRLKSRLHGFAKRLFGKDVI